MRSVKYRGPMALPSQTARHLDQETLERLRVEVPDSLLTDGILIFGPGTNHTVEMSNEASESLVAALPDEFEIVEDSDEVEQVASPMTDQANPQNELNFGDDDETDNDEESSDDD